MSSITRSRRSPYSSYSWALVDEDRLRRGPAQKKGKKELAPKKGAAQSKARLLDMLLDKKTGNRPPPSRAQPMNGKPRWSNDKDEFRLPEDGTKGVPVRLSSKATTEDSDRIRADGGDRWRASQWFADGFEDPSKRTT